LGIEFAWLRDVACQQHRRLHKGMKVRGVRDLEVVLLYRHTNTNTNVREAEWYEEAESSFVQRQIQEKECATARRRKVVANALNGRMSRGWAQRYGRLAEG
jgi:hypothetical protein